MKDRIRIAISSCLLGRAVRYDGGHKLDQFLADIFGQLFDLIPVCPEVEAGLSIPREPMRLVGRPESASLRTIETKTDYTALLENWARKRVRELKKEKIRGFIFKNNSPSCGLRDIEVLDEKAGQTRNGIGIFARIFIKHFPNCPVEDEARLHDPDIREKFIQRVFSTRRRSPS